MARAILSVLVTVTSLAAASLAAQCDTVFQDGFESSDASGWEVWRPPPCTTWQWQLSGVIDTSYDVAMYDIDLFETSQATIVALHAAGRRVICYLSAGSWESWRPDAGSFPEGVLGNALAPPFADERWLDVRQVAVLGPIVGDRMDLAVSKGCDGVEPDNVDGYANDTGFPISYQDQLVYNRLLAAMAHQRGLSVGLKNDLEQIGDLVASFDWALDEQTSASCCCPSWSAARRCSVSSTWAIRKSSARPSPPSATPG